MWIWLKGNTYSLLLGVESGTAIMEISVSMLRGELRCMLRGELRCKLREHKKLRFEFRQCGTHFIKDGTQYTLATRDLCSQARNAHINFLG